MSLYLTLDLLSVSIPLLASFYPKAPFYKNWRYLWVSTLVPAVVFIAWDIAFTEMGVWGFNQQYLSGIYFFNLPLEEVLFFICIPYACLFTYFALTELFEKDYLFPHQELISSGLSIVCMILGLYNMDKWYTGVTFFALGIFLAYQMLILKPRYMGRFYFAFGFILIPFFIVNGILTGSFLADPVVWYNDAQNLGLRLGTVPVEDIFYGMLLLVTNVAIYEYLKMRREEDY